MKNLNTYKELGLKSQDDIFDYLINNLKPSNRLWSYFVNWEKVFSTIRKYEREFNLLNVLIGKEDFDNEFKTLLKEYPKVIEAIPFLAVRSEKSESHNIIILEDYKKNVFSYKNFCFKKENNSDKEINDYLIFMEKTGLKSLLLNKKIKNVVDYMLGVEAGLNSNARKNRGGLVMEEITEFLLKDFCKKNNFKLIKQANKEKIYSEFKIKVPIDKSNRSYDFVIFANNKIYVIETNFYSSGGSKLKATAGEYKSLFKILENKNIEFIWITDGLGWQTATRPLKETFIHNKYLITLKLIEDGVLKDIIK